MPFFKSSTGRFVSKKSFRRVRKVSEATRMRNSSDVEEKTVDAFEDRECLGETDTSTSSTSQHLSDNNLATARHQQDTIETNDGYIDIIIGDPASSRTCPGNISSDHCYATSELGGHNEDSGDDIDTINHEEIVDSEDGSQSDKNEWNWRSGRRVVELGVLADGLSKCCKCCHPLHLSNCVGETQRGLGGFLHIVCMNSLCSHKNLIAYGKQHTRKWPYFRSFLKISQKVEQKPTLNLLFIESIYSTLPMCKFKKK